MASLAIKSTKNYGMFTRCEENRETNPGRRRRLERSMRKYGFLPCFPIVCRREGGKLVVLEGQHRLAIAESLGLPAYWVETLTDFDIAEINCTSESWKVIDYCQRWAKDGRHDYQEVMDFAEEHGIHVGAAAALLAGIGHFRNMSHEFTAGRFQVREREWATNVAELYAKLCKLSPEVRSSQCLYACVMVSRVEGFSSTRLIQGAQRCPEKLLSYSTQEAYLALFEELYNYNRLRLVGLKSEAIMAMRNRSASVAAAAKKQQKLKVAE